MVHVLGWMQIVPPGGKAVFVLHVFIFVLFVPLVFLHKRQKTKGGKSTANEFLAGQPKWAQWAVKVCLAYAVGHFFLFLYQTQKYPKHEVPLYLELRGFSGHWMMFYAACGFGYLELRREWLEKNAAVSVEPNDQPGS